MALRLVKDITIRVRCSKCGWLPDMNFTRPDIEKYDHVIWTGVCPPPCGGEILAQKNWSESDPGNIDAIE